MRSPTCQVPFNFQSAGLATAQFCQVKKPSKCIAPTAVKFSSGDAKDVEYSPGATNASTADSKARKRDMTRLLIRFKLFPQDLEVELSSLAQRISGKLPQGTSLSSTSEEPIAFGLVALIANIEADEKEGVLDSVEEVLKSVDGVSQVQYIAASRVSSKANLR